MVLAGRFDAGAGAPALLNDIYGKKDIYGAGGRVLVSAPACRRCLNDIYAEGHLWCRRACLMPAPARRHC